jgi:hypothetical protein
MADDDSKWTRKEMSYTFITSITITKKNLLLMNVNNMYLTYAHICKNHKLEFMVLSLLNFKIPIAHGFIIYTT